MLVPTTEQQPAGALLLPWIAGREAAAEIFFGDDT